MRYLARGLVRFRFVIIGIWVILGGIAFLRAPETPNKLNLRGGSDRITEARRADLLLHDRFGRPFSEFFAISIEGTSSFRNGRAAQVLDSLTAAAEAEPYVRTLISYATSGDSTFLSADERSTFFLLALDVPGDSAGAYVEPFRDVMRRTLARMPGAGEYTLRVTGRAPLDLDVRTVSWADSKRLEARLLPINLIILVLAFGALVAAFIPLLIGTLAIAVSLTIVGYLTAITPMSVFVLNMTTMIGLGVGIDYSLLVITRFREELNRGYRRQEAAIRTMCTAGVAVVTSGLTVVVGFSALLLTPLVETRSVGIGGLVVVAVAVLLSITFLPALLAIAGRSIDQPRWLARKLSWYYSPQVWEKWARSLSRHPRRALVLGLLGIGILTAPLVFIRVGLPARHWWPVQTEAGAGVEALNRMGVSGYLLPMRVVIEVPEGVRAASATTLRGLRALSDTLRADPRVRDVRSLVDLSPGTSILGYSLLYSDLDSARARHGAFLDAYLSTDARVTLVDVILADTTSLTSAMEVVTETRDFLAAGSIRQLRDTEISVGGYVAASVDFQDDLLARFPLLVLLTLTATGVMLAIAFRSILVPIKAIIMNSLSVLATFGLIVLVFQHGIGSQLIGLNGPTEAIFVAVPVLVFAVVFGLSMDYEVFLLSRIKEAYDRTGRNTEATMEGLSATASVITSAALIMIMVFGAFAFAGVLVMQFLGFGLAVAVLLDATIVRMVLVPAFMQLMGRWNWWPGGRVMKPEPADRPEAE